MDWKRDGSSAAIASAINSYVHGSSHFVRESAYQFVCSAVGEWVALTWGSYFAALLVPVAIQREIVVYLTRMLIGVAMHERAVVKGFDAVLNDLAAGLILPLVSMASSSVSSPATKAPSTIPPVRNPPYG